MQLYSTKNRQEKVSLKEAVFQGLPPDNGLYMPEHIPVLPADFLDHLESYSFQDIAFTVARNLMQGAIPDEDLRYIIENSIDFPAPVISLDEQVYILELFHGPSLAFKDFGARFMAQLMSYFNRGEQQDLVILVATSGDTGGAVAAGFYKTPGVKVVILYPSGKVSMLQEKQLTTLGHNIAAIEVDGTFDDCQAMVKEAFLDEALRERIRISSANSINIARLIPQSFYYFEAMKQMKKEGADPVVFCVPSGNFGNLTAGLIAQRMGLDIHHFIAATNKNDVVPMYLTYGKYEPRPSEATISNAMDVGNPSNFARMEDMFTDIKNPESSTWNNIKNEIDGYSVSDGATKEALKEVYEKHQYTIDPHGAVGYAALREYQKVNPETRGVILETAHPSKFMDDVEMILGQSVEIPERLAKLSEKEKVATQMGTEYQGFRQWLLENY